MEQVQSRRAGRRWERWTPLRVAVAVALGLGAVAWAVLSTFGAMILGQGGFFGTLPSAAERTAAALLWVSAAVCPAGVLVIVGSLRRDHRWIVAAAVILSMGLLAAGSQLGVEVDAANQESGLPVDPMIFAAPVGLAVAAAASWVRFGRSR